MSTNALLAIESDRLLVKIAPDFGARLVNLIDRRSGREWLTQGGYSPNTGEDAVYASPEAVGWDECFPTVSRCDATGTPWNRHLRDHGDLWGRPFAVILHEPDRLTVEYTGAEFRFVRTLRIEGSTMSVQYHVRNNTDRPLPYLWALHALLKVEAGDRIELEGIDAVRPSYLSTHAGRSLPGEMNWHGPGPHLPFPLSEVQPQSSGFAAKFLASGKGGMAHVGRDGSWLTFDWEGEDLALGLWLTYGGWPKPGAGSHQEIAIEPTNAMADELNQAIAAGAPAIPPGGTKFWEVRLTVTE